VKLAWLTPNLHPSGGPRMAMELGAEMAARGHDFSIYIPSGRCRMPVKPGVRVVECGWAVKNPLTAIAAALASMPKLIDHPEIILASMPPYALLAEKIGRDKHIPVVNYMQGDDFKIFDDGTYIKNPVLLYFYHRVAQRSFKIADIWVNSHWTGVQLLKHSGRKPTAILSGGFNPACFYPSSSTKTTMDGPIRLVTIGRKPRAKGLEDVIEALNLLNPVSGGRTFSPPLSGGTPDLREILTKPFILKVITQDDLDLSAARFPVEVVKPRDDMELGECYRSGDIFVNASWREGFGLTLLEALACGLAVVTTNCGGVREFVQPEVNALMVPPREPNTLAKAVARAIEDDALRRRLAQRGLETTGDFTWARAAERFEALVIQTVAEFH